MVKRKSAMVDKTPSLKRTRKTVGKKILQLDPGKQLADEPSVSCRPKSLKLDSKNQLKKMTNKKTNISPLVEKPIRVIEMKTPTTENTRKATFASPLNTPLTKDYFMMSQTTETQPEVVWDCYSPETFGHLVHIRSSKKPGQSVADIVQRLAYNGDGDVPSDLEAWLNQSSDDDTEPPSPASVKKLINRNGKPRQPGVTTRQKKMSFLTDDLVHRLTSDKQVSERLTRDRQVSDRCTDVESDERSLSDGCSASHVSHVFGQVHLPVKDEPALMSTQADDDVDWGTEEEDIFNDESFVIKATQIAVEFKTPNPVKKNHANKQSANTGSNTRHSSSAAILETNTSEHWGSKDTGQGTSHSTAFTGNNRLNASKTTVVFKTKRGSNCSGIGVPLASNTVTSQQPHDTVASNRKQSQTMDVAGNKTQCNVVSKTCSISSNKYPKVTGRNVSNTTKRPSDSSPTVLPSTLTSSTPLRKTVSLLKRDRDSPGWSDCSLSDDILFQLAEHDDHFNDGSCGTKTAYASNVNGIKTGTVSLRITKHDRPTDGSDSPRMTRLRSSMTKVKQDVISRNSKQCGLVTQGLQKKSVTRNHVAGKEMSEATSDPVRTKLFSNSIDIKESPFPDDEMLTEPALLAMLDKIESQSSQPTHKKCSPEEIEKKKQQALERRKKHLSQQTSLTLLKPSVHVSSVRNGKVGKYTRRS